MRSLISEPAHVQQLPCDATPLAVLARWPRQKPLMMLHSARAHNRWARWTIMATPAAVFRFDGRSSLTGTKADEFACRLTHDPLTDLDALLNGTSQQLSSRDLPWAGGWIGNFSYGLGTYIEPRACSRHSNKKNDRWPLIELAWCPTGLVYDQLEKTWSTFGEPDSDILDCVEHNDEVPARDFHVGKFHPTILRSDYIAKVERVKEYIRAGDIFQANIAQEFTAAFSGSARALAAKAFAEAQPWYGAYLEWPGDQHSPGRTILSLSPELFLHVNPTNRTITSRPIKGTRSATQNAGDLRDSAKDAAELHMIIDLMRNDLGRVCEYGSITVPQARVIETHPTVHHGVGEVTGVLRDGITIGEILEATFPGGSITGAPKIRAMQVIDELEPSPRGPYCGAIGMLSDSGGMMLNITIRTLLITHGQIFCSVGAGIVADSDPESEYQETLWKLAFVNTLK
jgi:para-aminobenzoate synthetase component 1